MTSRKVIGLAAVLVLTSTATLASAQLVPLKEFPIPPPAEWAPEGCRDVESLPDVLPSRATWRNLHADVRSSDEISRAAAPVFETDWQTELNTYNPTGPVFDDEGNVYFSPLAPPEPVALIALDPEDGSRRWAIPNTTGAVAGASTPILVEDPTRPGEQALFLILSDRAFAVRPDGSTIWDVPVDLLATGPVLVIGIQYHEATDSIVGVGNNGVLVAIDRTTGAQTVPPFELPGTVTPTPPSNLPPAVGLCLAQKFAQFTDLASAGLSVADLVNTLLGNGIEVANSFSIDSNTGRLWVAATAPDEADGTVDGISEFGALYGIDIVPDNGGVQFSQVCRADFSGGTAATPAVKADGTRVYTADNFGGLIAFNASDCSQEWILDVGAQVFGSVGVGTDNNVLYASSRTAVREVFDRGDHGELGWVATPEVFDIPLPLQPVLSHFNLLLAGVTATSVSVQVGVGVPTETRDLPIQQAIALIDRETGETRWASEGLDESVAVMSTGPDGASYIGNSPLRRVITRCLLELAAAEVIPPVIPLPPGTPVDLITPPITGGITKYAPQRLDLLIRDDACAATDRARNAADVNLECPDSVEQDITQIGELIDQAREAAPTAIADGDLSRRTWKRINFRLKKGELWLHVWKVFHEFFDATFALNKAERQFEAACETLDE